MKVKVEACWSGGKNYYFRLTLPDGSRESVPGESWTRKVASQALDLIESNYKVPRRKIRFY